MAYGSPQLPTVCVLEIITPSGVEDLFKVLGQPGNRHDPSAFPALVASSGWEVDSEGTAEVAERFGPMF
ncbi:MAG: hypothetical protein K0R38_7915 [Polyangiaceae bacterium]|nr:hypothetical protein [Polyangiaceae bacterium]